MEAQNLIALTNQNTPLIGGVNTPLHPSDFTGATPKPSTVQTPNVMATPFRTPSGPQNANSKLEKTPILAIASPAPSSKISLTPQRTPLRDELRINAVEEDTEEQKRQEQSRKLLLSSLSKLPQPKNEINIVVPELPDKNDKEEDNFDIDAEDIERMKRLEIAEREKALLAQRSQAVQQDLPRPFTVNKIPLKTNEEIKTLQFIQQAEEILKIEMQTLLEHDAIVHPVRPLAKRKQTPEIEQFQMPEIEKARTLVEDETKIVHKALHPSVTDNSEEHLKAWEECYNELMYFPTQEKYARVTNASRADKIAAYQKQLEINRDHMQKEATRASKLEGKVKVLNQGYETRSKNLTGQITDLNNQLDQLDIELQCFKKLHQFEQAALPRRFEAISIELNKQIERESQLQKYFANLQFEKRRITSENTT